MQAVVTDAARQPRPASRNVRQSRERIVMVCMGVVTAAIAAMMYAQFGYSLAASVLTGGIAWCGFMLAHIQSNKNDQIGKLKSDVIRLQAELARVRGGEFGNEGANALAGAALDGAKPAPRLRGRGRRPQAMTPGEEAAASPAPNAADVSAPLKLDPGARWETQPVAPQSRLKTPASLEARPAPALPAGTNQPPPVALDAALWPGTSVSGSDPMSDLWAFRPNATALPQTGVARGGDPTGGDGRGAAMPPTQRLGEAPAMPAAAPPVSTIDADLELVQRKIKALADEVNAAEAMKALAEPQAADPSLPGAIEATIGALKSTAKAMRVRPAQHQPQSQRMPPQPAAAAPVAAGPAALPPATAMPGLPADLFIPATAQTIASSESGPAQPSTVPQTGGFASDAFDSPAAPPVEPAAFMTPSPAAQPEPFDPDAFDRLVRATAPPPVQIHPEVAALSHAVEKGQMDVYLTPIVGLDTYEVRHYEVTVRVKDESGAYLDHQDRTLELAGPGLLALFDAARLTRTAYVADRLSERGKSGSLLSNVAGASMTDGDFLETFARIYETRSAISSQLVLTFSQADIEQLTPGAWQALGDMQAFGFRFALDRLDHLDMDFAGLAERGFAFVKLPASALLQGVPSRDRFVEPHEACKRLAGAGLTLVAETIDDEALRARVFGFGVLLGQGQLFGGARHISVDQAPGASRSEAA